ncbi:MAG: hypothetical protein ABIR32_07550 [Ilumatobacteraceae bacterium]
MKTRTLLLLAVASGLVILLAGSIKLFLIADEKAPAHLVLGETGKIGDMTVTVLSVDRSGSETYISVRLVGVDDPDGATSWVLGVVGEQLRPLAPPTSVGPACEATSADTETDCVLAFRTTAIGVLTYGRADETIRWDIPT